MADAAVFGFDPDLPSLPQAFDPRTVARLFAPAGGAVGQLRRQDTKYQPGVRCVVTYEVELIGATADHRRRTIGVVTATPQGLERRFMEEDRRLTGLAEALDGRRMAARLAAALGPVEACAATPVRYKPNDRCVIRYELRNADGPRLLFGKLLADGWSAKLALLDALAVAGHTDEAVPPTLPVVAHLPDLGLLLQPAVDRAVELNRAGFDPAVPAATRAAWLRAAGRHLAGLQGCALPGAPERALAADLDELATYIAPMYQADPPLARRYQAVLDTLEQHVGAAPPPQPVAGHGAFRTDQFLLPGGDAGTADTDTLVMIDLDGACRAEPARDLGNFLAYLDWKTIRRPDLVAVVGEAEGAVLAGYAAQRPLPAAERLDLCRAASLLKIAGRRYRSLATGEWHLVPALVDRAAALLG
ncbi:MAG TPA: hypothetical protein VF995_05065 [Actinomycetota bacterium]